MRLTEPCYFISDSRRISRRSFLFSTCSLAAAAVWSSRALGAVAAHPHLPGYPFQLGVASGDPAPDGFVLWTRLAPLPLEEGGGMPDDPVTVSWQVAEDEKMTRLVQQGKTVAVPAWAHSVHVEVAGLRPDRWYWYRFIAGKDESMVGRTRTMPAVGASPDRLRFAFASCQHYETGFYTAYDYMAREDLDLVFHLGDYIYSSHKADAVRSHLNQKVVTLEEYRSQYALYKTDPDLQRIHAQVPFVMSWDDHEVKNNYAGGSDRSPEQLRRRADAYKAYYEHMPLRRSALSSGPDMKIYRSFAFGRLANFFVLDTRQYRTTQPEGPSQERQALSSRGTILGARQRDWLFSNLRFSSSRWNVLAQQVMMARVDFQRGEGEEHAMDKWAGYEKDRRAVLSFLRDQKIANPVVLTGDVHDNWAIDLAADFEGRDPVPVGTEFVGTSISSSGDGSAKSKREKWISSENPFVRFFNAERGYVRCEVTPADWRTDFRTVEYVSRRGAPLHTRASFAVPAGKPGLQNA